MIFRKILNLYLKKLLTNKNGNKQDLKKLNFKEEYHIEYYLLFKIKSKKLDYMLEMHKLILYLIMFFNLL